MNWLVITMNEIFIITILFQGTLGFDLFDSENHPELIPVQKLESRGPFVEISDDQLPMSDIISYLRPGRRMLKLPQTLIPYPRTGRFTEEDIPTLLEYLRCFGKTSEDNDNGSNLSIRLKRKKRSSNDELSEQQAESEDKERKMLSDRILKELSLFKPMLYMRRNRGPSNRSRNSFVPRVGKRVSEEDWVEEEDKRAMAFTPRIGRGGFVPRIGRRSMFTPRVGRSS